MAAGGDGEMVFSGFVPLSGGVFRYVVDDVKALSGPEVILLPKALRCETDNFDWAIKVLRGQKDVGCTSYETRVLRHRTGHSNEVAILDTPALLPSVEAVRQAAMDKGRVLIRSALAQLDLDDPFVRNTRWVAREFANVTAEIVAGCSEDTLTRAAA